MMKIEKSIPIPAKSKAGRPSIYPFGKMEIEDSLFFDGQDTQGRAALAARAYARNHDVKFIARTEGTGVRIWRTA